MKKQPVVDEGKIYSLTDRVRGESEIHKINIWDYLSHYAIYP